MPGPRHPYSNPNNNSPLDRKKGGQAILPRLRARASVKGGRLWPNIIGALHHTRDGRHYRVMPCSASPMMRRGMFRRCDAQGVPIPRLRLSKKLRRLMRAELFRTEAQVQIRPARPVRGRGMAAEMLMEVEI